jgi:hypothetical protein
MLYVHFQETKFEKMFLVSSSELRDQFRFNSQLDLNWIFPTFNLIHFKDYFI